MSGGYKELLRLEKVVTFCGAVFTALKMRKDVVFEESVKFVEICSTK